MDQILRPGVADSILLPHLPGWNHVAVGVKQVIPPAVLQQAHGPRDYEKGEEHQPAAGERACARWSLHRKVDGGKGEKGNPGAAAARRPQVGSCENASGFDQSDFAGTGSLAGFLGRKLHPLALP